MTNVFRTWSLVTLLLIAIWQIADVTARYHHIKLRHARHRRRHTEGYLPRSFVLDSNDPEEGQWGAWTPPSSCSRSCGGGVAYQTRRCHEVDNNGYERCTGAKKRYFSCNIQPCGNDTADFRAEQCAEYNSKDFDGVYYEWIPYTGAANKCELNCMPKGERFFYRHKPHVIDGTPCDVEKNDVCVEGRCMTVGCDMMLGSDAREDGCRKCGGDGSDCNTVRGLFETNDLQVGYIDILLIPEGATNIVIKERAPSNNYLAIRNSSGHYYLNGNWKIDFPRRMNFANTIFHYSRDPQGEPAPDIITAAGPTSEPIVVVLISQDRNVGVNYEYSIPKNYSPQSDPDSYVWTADEFSECSVSCGGGFQSRQVVCIRRRDNQPVDDSLCDLHLEPDDTQSCNEEACPPEWVESEWAPCSKPCGEGGERTREIKCEQIIAGGIPTVVDDAVCLESVGIKNETTQKCNENVECPMWHLGPWKPCDHLCGKGKQTRKVTCYRKDKSGKIEVLDDSVCEGEVPEKEKECELRPCTGVDWIVSEWSGCTEKCGLIQETRTAYCASQDGTVYPDDKCEMDKKPELTRPCENVKGCDYQWYTTQWSECSAKCGKGVQTRQVFCATFEDDVTLKKVSDEKCNPEKRYNDTKECEADIVECKGEWFAGPWSKCSKPCGGGDMSRKVICVKDNETVSATNCDQDSIMFSTEECNKQSCTDDEIIPVESTQTTVIPVDEDEECEVWEDEFETVSSMLTSEFDKSTSPEPSEGTGFTDTDETMMSDGAWTRGDISPDTGSGFSEGDEGSGDELLTFSTAFTTGELTSFEGSGSSPEDKFTSESVDFTGSTETSVSEKEDTTTEKSSDVTDESTSIESSSPSGTSDITSLVTESSEKSSDTDGTSSGTEESVQTSMMESSSPDSSSESSDLTTESSVDQSTVSSESSTDAISSSESGSTVESLSEATETSSSVDETSGGSTEMSTESSTISMTSSSDLTSSSDSSSESNTEQTSSTSSDITETTDTTITESTPTDNTDTTVTEITPTSVSDSSETTESVSATTSSEETGSTSESAASTDVTEMSTSVTDLLTTTTELPFTILPLDGESEKEDESKTEGSSILPSSETEVTGSSDTSDITEISTDQSGTEESTMESSTQSGSPEGSTLTSESSSGSSTEISATGSTIESTTTAESSGSTGSTIEETTGTGISSEATSESQMTSTEGSTISSMSTESSASSESTTEMSTVSGETSTFSTDTTVFQTTETEEEEDTDLTEKSTITDLFTTISPASAAIEKEHKIRKCKVKKKKKTCKTSEFGCCYDGVTPAEGPFGKNCPVPETCAETQYGCCPDGVSVAKGPDNDECPSQHCKETLFGCCQDGETPAEGNDFEGCKKPCNQTEFGCCPDKETPASGKDNYGCCNVTEFGCCPDGIKIATGPNGKGCEEANATEIVKDCANSTHGCCPDGKTSATGINFEGCGVINKENCTASYFGCCRDNQTAALGPNEEGCHAPCESSTYGCCPDRYTPAHGPNGEGCCLSSPYKCCPDNILPARGPDFYGCGCQYSRFRCCPDNATAARGPNNEGCGCQFTPHGCCPNKFTPATGPKFEGCPCHTYQFGCCPDGITIAKGPRGHGCSCENTEFGCCSDGRTPAKGANFAGCACDSSKYGCCPDGIEEAQGENFEGCLTIPVPAGAACSLAKDRGSCRDFTVKWFFDTEYGGCSRFWYGGCEGNNNRFKTQEECKETCVSPKGRNACFLPKSTGPCEGYYPKWYYDSERKQCGQFVWGGCLGNNNKFETREECEDLCVIPDDIDACELEKELGPCNGNFSRWYFNKEAQTCEQFNYGGCKGNANNFNSEVACHQQCLQPGRRRDYCSLPRAEGNCTEKYPRWYFDPSENRCMPFYYRGCGGNRNNFDTRQACENDCPPKIEQDICLLPAVLGKCHNYTQRWYYDSFEQRCRQFYYGGCEGNENNFATESECSNRCVTSTTPAPTKPQRFSPAMCFLPDEHGPCNNEQTKWFYDSRDGTCKQFTYGGCASNGNKFDSMEECEYRCGTIQDVCAMPKIVGPCSGFAMQFYYNRETDTCDEFEYSGCGGNKNRFQDRETCERRCGRRPVEPPKPQTPAPEPPTEVVPSSPICNAPVDAGSCDDEITAYYYDARNRVCQAFIYGGCEGNANRFQSEEQCERLCGKFKGQEVCNLPMDNGPCRGSFAKYFYDPNARACRQFYYGGCDGNANRFSTIPECESVCLHREEPTPAGNKTGRQQLAICREPVDVGSCPTGNYKRFYFDDDRQTCMGFVYTGCGGNRNRFKTFESCMQFCYRPTHEPDNRRNTTDPCEESRKRCQSLQCPYGKEEYVDSRNCEQCSCIDPCYNINCPEGSKCSITLVAGANEGTEYRAVCRTVTKPGQCPRVSNSTRCERECETDADCSEDWKCCDNGCGTSCLEPALDQTVQPLPPVHNITALPHGAMPAMIQQPDNPHVSGEEGGYVSMKCIVIGFPKPIITWKKDATIIDIAEPRRRILGDGTLEIINLYSYDRGTYVCTADNGLAPPVKTEYQLEVTEPHDRSAAIVGEQNTKITVTMNSPTVLHCYAMGWPRPSVTWWHGERLLPLSSESYEQDSEYSLLIRSVTITNLGVYTCQAYNGVERPASWSVILQAIGPVYNVKPEYEEYTRYLVQPPKKPEQPVTSRPSYPYRPYRTQTPEYNQTYAPIYPPHSPYVPPVIAITDAPQQTTPYQVPVSVNVSAPNTEVQVGSEFSVQCSVSGYPAPRVSWYRSDNILRPDGRITISDNNTLVINSAVYNDTGIYRCEASNQYSSDDQTIQIIVSGTYIDPDCEDNTFFARCDLIVKAKYCQHKYYAKFCCRSCTEAGQLSVRQPYTKNVSRRRRSAIDFF